jgi:hypothetical protein
MLATGVTEMPKTLISDLGCQDLMGDTCEKHPPNDLKAVRMDSDQSMCYGSIKELLTLSVAQPIASNSIPQLQQSKWLHDKVPACPE